MKQFVIAALAATLILAGSGAAHAGTYTAAYTGVVTDVDEGNHLLGDATAVGDPIQALFTYTTDVPGTRSTEAGFSDEVTGGLDFGTDAVITSATFSIGGQTVTFSPNYYGDVFTSPGLIGINGYAYSELNYAFQTYILPNAIGPTSLSSAFVSDGKGDTSGRYGQFSFLTDGTDTIDFNATRIEVSAAPEAATWLLMLLGVATMGLALRRRHHPQTPNSFASKAVAGAL